MVNSATAFNNAICSLCYKGFEPSVEDLQVISICGHVFHELCLQEWFGYDSGNKRPWCPVCKQGCSENDVARLYFQWASAVTGQKPVTDSDALHQELCVCKQQAKKEFELKNEALKQQASLQQLLHMKSQEFDELNLEFLRLQERDRALEKELAAAKLVSDLGLDEEEVLKVDTIGNGGKRRDTIDVLRKSLVISNRNYKELVAKYNLLEQKEARYCKRLEKAKRKRKELVAKYNLLEQKEARYCKRLEKAKRKRNKYKLRNMALEKEFAAAKLVSDLGLDEEEVLKVATIGNGGKRRDTIDVLRNSLVISNRSYKELVAKYNLLEKKETRYCKRLEKAKRKRNKYKTKVQHLEMAVELKGDEFLRALETSKKSLGGVVQDGLNQAASDTKKRTSVNGLCNLVQPLGSVSGTYNPAANTSNADVVIIDDDDDEPIQPVLNVRKASPIPHPLPGPANETIGYSVLTIETLTGNNFKRWKADVELYLVHHDYDLCLRNPCPPEPTYETWESEKLKYDLWQKANRMAIGVMKKYMTESIRGAITDHKHAVDYLQAVSDRFKECARGKSEDSIEKLSNMQFDDTGSVREHVMKMVDAANRLKAVEVPVPDDLLVGFVLNSLPDSYGHLKVSYNAQLVKWSIDELLANCLQEENRQLKKKNKAPAPTPVVTGSAPSFGEFEKAIHTPKPTPFSLKPVNTAIGKECFHCKKIGHLRRNCSEFTKWMIKTGITKPYN